MLQSSFNARGVSGGCVRGEVRLVVLMAVSVRTGTADGRSGHGRTSVKPEGPANLCRAALKLKLVGMELRPTARCGTAAALPEGAEVRTSRDSSHQLAVFFIATVETPVSQKQKLNELDSKPCQSMLSEQ
jgi:hypothetical protein